MLVEYLVEHVCVSMSHSGGRAAALRLECRRCRVSGKFATGQSHFVSVSPVQALSVCFVFLSCRAKSFTDTHSYSLLTGAVG